MRLDPSVKDRFRKGLSDGWNPAKRREFWVARLPNDVVRDTNPEGKVVLDAGTGRGRFAIAFAKAGAKRVIAVDISPLLVKFAREEVEKVGVSDRIAVEVGDVEDLKYDDDSFDIACSMGTTIHLPNPSKGIAELKRVCKPSGLVVTNAVLAGKTKEGSYWKTFTEDEFRGLFRENGLEIRKERMYFQADIEVYGMMVVALIPCG